MFLTLYTYLVKSTYYIYLVTVSYYCGCCPVEEKEVDKFLSNVNQLKTVPIELKTKPLGYYHRKMVTIPGTMQQLTSEWQIQHPDKQLPFDQRYRLQFLNKVLKQELVNVKKSIDLIIANKKDAVQASIRDFIPENQSPNWTAKEIMDFAYPSNYCDCRYYLIGDHYLRLAQLARLSYKYIPFCYLLAYSLLVLEWYYFIKYGSGEIKKYQFDKSPSKLYNPYKTIYYDMCVKSINQLGKQVNQQLSLCNKYFVETENCELKKGIEATRTYVELDTKNLSHASSNFHSQVINKAWGTPLQKALMTQNSTAIRLAIADLSFHGIQQNSQENYLLIPFNFQKVDKEADLFFHGIQQHDQENYLLAPFIGSRILD